MVKSSVQEEEDVLLDEEIKVTWKLVVYNDDVNPFDHVIHSFMVVLKHTMEQATQCAYIIHTKGRYTVKDGSFDDLVPYRDALNERYIDAKIEES